MSETFLKTLKPRESFMSMSYHAFLYFLAFTFSVNQDIIAQKLPWHQN